MGRRGPPPLPTAVKKARGTYRKDRAAPREPKPPTGTIVMPSHLGPAARVLWKELLPHLTGMGVMSPAFRRALELLCAAYQEYRDASRRPKPGEPKDSLPGWNARSDAWRRVVVGLREFGLTPSALSRVNSGSPPPAPPPPSPAPRPATGHEDPDPESFTQPPHDPDDPFGPFVDH